LEESPFKGKIGWQVFINSDEEVGSPGSKNILQQLAPNFDIGMVFEPPFPDGTLVSARKGSANYTIVAKGKAAHAGRDFDKGINAISSIIKFIKKVEKLTSPKLGTTVNIGFIEGGGPINIVPNSALCRFNIRLNNL